MLPEKESPDNDMHCVKVGEVNVLLTRKEEKRFVLAHTLADHFLKEHYWTAAVYVALGPVLFSLDDASKVESPAS